MVKRWTDRMAGVKYAPRPYEKSATVLEGGISRMRWIVRVARTMDDVKECHFTDKDKALKHIEALKKLSMAVDATVWMEEINDDEQG